MHRASAFPKMVYFLTSEGELPSGSINIIVIRDCCNTSTMKKVQPLVTPFCMLIAASSKSGKTVLASDLIVKHYLMFDEPIEEAVWLYHKRAFNGELFQKLEAQLKFPIRFIEGFPAEQLANGELFHSDDSANKLLIMDDVVVGALRSPVFIDLFTIISHHSRINVIGIIQNLHADTASQRQIMNSIIRNLSYIVLFPDRRNMAACKQVARTYFNGEESKLLEPFKYLIKNGKKHDYMVIDFVDKDDPIKFNTLRSTDDAFLPM